MTTFCLRLIDLRPFGQRRNAGACGRSEHQFGHLPPGTDESNVDRLFDLPSTPKLNYNGGQFAINGLPVDALGAPVGHVRYVLSGAAPDDIWDVSNPLEVKRMQTQGPAGSLTWDDLTDDTTKRYLAFRWNAAKRPLPMGPVANSNLHALEDVDYVVVSTPKLLPAADSLASLHAATGLRVAVVPQQNVFDAFSAGVADPTAIKMLMMMLTDRAQQSQGEIGAPQLTQ